MSVPGVLNDRIDIRAFQSCTPFWAGLKTGTNQKLLLDLNHERNTYRSHIAQRSLAASFGASFPHVRAMVETVDG